MVFFWRDACINEACLDQLVDHAKSVIALFFAPSVRTLYGDSVVGIKLLGAVERRT